MFIRYEYIENLGEDPENHINRWKYKIVDDDFTEEGIEYGIGIWYSCFDTYEKRNLPVAKNIIRVLKWYVDYLINNFNYTDYNIKYASFECQTGNPEKYAKYADEIEKYLLLV
jgi:hypothetical protein